MQRTNLKFGTFCRAHVLKLAAVAVLLMGCFPARSMAQQPGQKTFSSAEDACKAIAAAAQSSDDKAMLDLLGPDGKQIVSSGDAVEDAENRANFARRYQEMHRWMKEPDGKTTLYIGAENWPVPIPLVNKGGVWFYDTDAGKQEILFRRVGRNEMSAIRISEALVAAQKEYYSMQQGGAYAEKIFSDEGQHNGLYWKVSGSSEPQSPIGPLVAAAVAEGYTKGEGAPTTPYHGYYFRTLTRQGKNAPGDARNYIVNGKMTEGYAFVAYPAEYRSSGVMTFIINEDGVVYQKDLGEKTGVIAKTMKEYNPGAGWKKAVDDQPEMASAQKPK